MLTKMMYGASWRVEMIGHQIGAGVATTAPGDIGRQLQTGVIFRRMFIATDNN